MGASVRIAVAIAALAALLPASASAAYPGSNGRLVFERDGQIWTSNADGTGAVQLTTSPTDFSSEPEWSPDGTKIAYKSGSAPPQIQRVRIMNADGSGDTTIPNPHHDAWSPTWSPDGSRIAFVSSFEFSAPRCNTCLIQYVIEADPDGSDQRVLYSTSPVNTTTYLRRVDDLEWSPKGDEILLTRLLQSSEPRRAVIVAIGTGPGERSSRALTADDANSYGGSWSPDAARVTYLEDDTYVSAFRMNPDGTGKTFLFLDRKISGLEWSPDGTKLVWAAPGFSCDPFETSCPNDIWITDSDGGGDAARIVTNTANESWPDWQPVIDSPSGPGFPRPKGATPIRVSLVPAHDPCTAPNRTHGPPLAFGSCAPPTPTSADTTVGTPDNNGAPARMQGSLELKVLVGNPATPADEADVRLKLNVTDVRDAGLDDYIGNLEPRLSLRLTDRYNLPAPRGRLAGTMTIQAFAWLVPCPGTADTTIGSTCSSTTSADAIVPGTIVEGRRSNIEVGQVEVLHYAEDVFLRQGVFIP